MSSSSFRDSPAKRTVREQWNTPFLRYIHDTYGIKYRYMGFPGTDLIDIKLWKDMIEEVIAFEFPSPGRDNREWIKSLRANLKKLGIRGVAYLGSFEEVVILRRDFEGQAYKQDKVITLYNLDFCDEISSPVETLERGKKRLRFEAIRVILQDQKRCYMMTGEPCYFILLLTVRNQIEASKIRDFLSRDLLSETSSYYESCEGINPIPTSGPLIGSHAWSLKAFLYNTLMGYFKNPNISTLLFPIIKYRGTKVRVGRESYMESPMLHWMILCKFGSEENPNPNSYPASYLDTVNSLYAEKSGIKIEIEPGEIEDKSQSVSPVDWFKKFESVFSSDGRLL